MNKNISALALHFLMAILPLTLAAASAAAQGVTVIADFGQTPQGAIVQSTPLVFDKEGNLYGVVSANSNHSHGAVFELTKKPNGLWARKTLHIFTGRADGDGPLGPLVFDAAGNLYGTTEGGGRYGWGTVFELSPSSDGSWTVNVLYNIPGYPDLETTSGGLILDSAGNLYGVISNSVEGHGAVFQLTPQEDGSWKHSILHSFAESSQDGYPDYGLTMDRAGNLYGTTLNNKLGAVESRFAGVVFELSPGSNGAWNYTVLHRFLGWDSQGKNLGHGDGVAAESGVIVDANGNLYGTTYYGGAYNDGAVFEIPTGQGPDGPDEILYSFHSVGHGGWSPLGGLVFDSSGNLYGTTLQGGVYRSGKIFEMHPNGDGTWKMTALHDFGGQTYNGFTGIDGDSPAASMVFGADGNLYGTTLYGGYHPGCTEPGCLGSTVFELKLH
jgi:uncharacterized repeat protein (TIGR03803 family)